MFNFTEGHVPLWFKLLYLILYVIIFVVGINKLGKKRSISEWSCICLFTFFTVFSVYYCLSGDYFQYEVWVKLKYNRDIWFKEQFYLYLIRFVRFVSIDYCYDLFRLIIWGGALMFFCLINRKSERDLYFSMLFLFLIFYEAFSYARASLAMAVYFFGLSLFANKDYKNKIVGILVLLSSLLFHMEMIVPIALTPIVVLLSLENKSIILKIIVFLGVVVFIIANMGDVLPQMESISISERSYSDRADQVNEQIASGRWETLSIGRYIGYTLFYIPFVVIVRTMLSGNSTKIKPIIIIYLYRMTFCLILVSMIFAAIFGFGNVYHYRILNICIIPISILLSYLFVHRHLSVGFVTKLLIFSFSYQIIKLFLRALEA